MLDKIIKIKSFSRNKKMLIISFVDLLLALLCWIIFGPILSALLITNFEVDLLEIFILNYLNFLIPFLFTSIYFYLSGMYRSSIRFSDSRDLTVRSIKGAFIFGFTWGFIYLYQFEIVRNQFLYSLFFRSIFLSFVFYSSIQIVRDLARILIYPNNLKSKGKPILIYGAGAAGNELYQALKNNPKVCQTLFLVYL